MKTSTLTGADLNRAVAMSLGYRVLNSGGVCDGVYIVEAGTTYFLLPDYAGDIAVAWPIIKTEIIGIDYNAGVWEARDFDTQQILGFDADPQIAAMRCFVASVYGDEIDLEPK